MRNENGCTPSDEAPTQSVLICFVFNICLQAMRTGVVLLSSYKIFCFKNLRGILSPLGDKIPQRWSGNLIKLSLFYLFSLGEIKPSSSFRDVLGNKKNSFAIKNPVSNLEQGAGFEPATTQPTQAVSSVLTELPLLTIYE